jgi:hypothetical protein
MKGFNNVFSAKCYLCKRNYVYWYIGTRVLGKVVWKSTHSRTKVAALRLAPEFIQLKSPSKGTPTIAPFFKQYLDYLLSQRSQGT